MRARAGFKNMWRLRSLSRRRTEMEESAPGSKDTRARIGFRGTWQLGSPSHGRTEMEESAVGSSDMRQHGRPPRVKGYGTARECALQGGRDEGAEP
jgi:hypothetical protein